MSTRRDLSDNADSTSDAISRATDDASAALQDQLSTIESCIQSSLAPHILVPNTAPQQCESVPRSHTTYTALKSSLSLSATASLCAFYVQSEQDIEKIDLGRVVETSSSKVDWSVSTFVQTIENWSTSTYASSTGSQSDSPRSPDGKDQNNFFEGRPTPPQPGLVRKQSSPHIAPAYFSSNTYRERNDASLALVKGRELLEAMRSPWSTYNLRVDMKSKIAAATSFLSLKPPSPCFIVSDNPYIFRDKLRYLLESLDPHSNPARVNNFFNGLDLVVGDLRNRFPNDVVVSGISKALESLDLLHQLNFARGPADITQWTSENIEPLSNTQNSGPDPGPGESSNGSRDLGSSNEGHTHPAKSNGSNTRGNVCRNPRGSTDKPSVGQVRRRRARDEKRLLACPISKHCQVHDLHLTCNFEGAANMWGVTQHLKTRAHRQFLPFLSLCRHCWVYVTTEDEYRTIHKEGFCQLSSQRRGSRVAENWQNLYRGIYPKSDRIPSPWIDEHNWVAIGPSTIASTSTGDRTFDFSFLGDQMMDHSVQPLRDQSTLNGEQQFPMPLLVSQAENAPVQHADSRIEHTQHLAEAAAMELFVSMFRDCFRRRGDLNDYYMDRLMTQTRHMDPEPVQQFSTRFLERAYSIFQRLQSHAGINALPANHPADMPTYSNNSTMYTVGIASEPTFQTSQLNGVWLGHFPVPDEMLRNPPGPSVSVPEEMLYSRHNLPLPERAQQIVLETIDIGGALDEISIPSTSSLFVGS